MFLAYRVLGPSLRICFGESYYRPVLRNIFYVHRILHHIFDASHFRRVLQIFGVCRILGASLRFFFWVNHVFSCVLQNVFLPHFTYFIFFGASHFRRVLKEYFLGASDFRRILQKFNSTLK